MPDNELSCCFNMFDFTQTLLKPNGTKFYIQTDDMVRLVPLICKEHGYTVFHLFGEDDYLEGIADAIYNFNENEYSGNTLEIKVNWDKGE